MFSIENGALVPTFAGERLLIEPWGENACGYAVRVRRVGPRTLGVRCGTATL